MKLNFLRVKIFALALSLLACGQTVFAQLSGTYTLPGTVNGTTVNDLTDLANLLSTSTVNATAIFEFTSSYSDVNESYPVTFTPFTGTGKVIIRPAASVASTLTTAGSPSANALIDLFGVQYVTFDGRPGGTGTTSEWLFENTASGGSYPTFRFINGAVSNTLEYLGIQGSGTNTTGDILFSTSTAAGNSFNVVQYCNIGAYTSLPYNGILSSGTVGAENSANSILNNNISNFQGYYAEGPYGGVNITSTGNGSRWNISGNSFYCTYVDGFYGVSGLVFNPGTGSTENIISGNFIGGQQPMCGGLPWKVSGENGDPAPDFNGIYINADSTTVTYNTIQNIKFAGAYYSQTIVGINIAGGVATVAGNTVGSAAVANSIHNEGMGVTLGIWDESPNPVILDSNTVANITLDDSSNPQFGITYGDIIGIYAYSSTTLGACTIINNQVFNISSGIPNTINQYYEINSGGGTFSDEMIWEQGEVAGIYLQNSSATKNLISKNIVHGILLNYTESEDQAYMYGIGFVGDGGTTTINANLVYGLWAPDSYGGSNYYLGITGIYLTSSALGVVDVYNNMVDLGTKPTDSTGVQNAMITGIWDNTTDNNTKLALHCLHNSVYIGGTDNNTENNNLSSYAFSRNLDYSSTEYDSLLINNNIFQNNRSTTSGTGLNYGLYLNSSIDVADNYNDIYGNGTKFFFGDVGGSDYVNLATFKVSNAGHETNSISANPQFTNAVNTTPNLHIINIPGVSPIAQAGTATTTLVYDFDSLLRANYNPVDIGATVDCSTAASSAQVTLGVSHDTICNSAVPDTFTATPTNGGSSPIYDFYLNGISVQNGSSNIYIPSTLQNNDSVKVVLTSNAACLLSNTGTSNSITIDVSNSNLSPSVTLTPSSNNICRGTSVTFTAAGTNGGNAPSYSFYVNGTAKQTGSQTTYSNSNLNNNDSVWVVLTSNETCVSPTTAKSAVIYMVVNSNVQPEVSIALSQNNVCQGTSITFTATPTNGGTSPTYDFYINGSSVQNGASAIYTSSVLHNNDSVWVLLTSNAPCDSPSTTATSAKLHLIINTKVQPAVALSASQTTICPNTQVTFTATPTNGGNAPAYNFFVNNTSVQNGSSPTYASSSLQNGDSVYVELTSNATCDSPTTAGSQKIYIAVESSITPQASLSASENNVCQGTSITFTAATTNGGATITYNFFVNGTSKQNGASNTYTAGNFNNGDMVWVVSENTGGCVSTPDVNSDTLLMSIISAVTPTVNLSASQTTICYGTSITFTATANNGGGAATYNFYKNGVSVQNGAENSYSSDSLHNNDSIWVVLTSSAPCASPSTAKSTGILISVTNSVIPSVSITASANSVCVGTSVTLTASSINGGNNPMYNFYLDGVSVQSGSSDSYLIDSLTGNSSAWVALTSNLSCASVDSATSDTISITVIPSVSPSITLTATTNSICEGDSVLFSAVATNGGNSPTYDFYLNTISVQEGSSSTYLSDSLSNNDAIWVVLNSSAQCASPVNITSDTITTTVFLPGASTVNKSICSGNSYVFNGTSLDRSGTYFDTLTTIHGCDSIIILHLAIVSTIRNQIADSICLGETYTFDGQLLNNSGTYYDTLNSSGGCDSITTLNLVVNPKPSPVVQQSGNDSLSTGSYSSYQWLHNGEPLNQATQQTYVASASGYYSVAVTDSNGCSDTSSVVVVTSTTNLNGDMLVQIYPNPSQDVVIFKLQGLMARAMTVSLFDVTGKQLFASHINVNQGEYSGSLNLAAFSSGIYFLHIDAGEESVVRKIEVMR